MRQQVITIIAIIIALGIGVFVGTKIKKTSAPAVVNNTYQTGWEDAMQTLKKTGALPQAPEGMEIRNINGVVQAISGNNITLEVTSPELVGNKDLLTRTVVIDANTKITKLIQKEPGQLQKEMEAFNEKNKEQSADPVEKPNELPYPVQMQEEQVVSISDVKVGQSIVVQSAEDVKDKQQFGATEIQIRDDASVLTVE